MYFASAWHLTKIAATTAWDTTQGLGQTIAIIDSGVDPTHPDLVGRLVAGWNFYDGNSNTTDLSGHGTGVAGAAAATTDNTIGVASVAGLAKIMPLRVTAPDGFGYWSMMAQAMDYAASKGVRVANISYDALLTSSAVVNAAQSAKVNKGMLTVIAGGNNDIVETWTPSTAVIAVSATNQSDVLTTWASRGPYVSLAAPGIDIWSTNRGGSYSTWYGSSLSSPVVAGVLALMFSANTALTAAQAESALFASADDLGTAGRDSLYGYGRVNAAAAVAAALGTAPPDPPASDVTAPTISITAPAQSATVKQTVAITATAADAVGVTKVEFRAAGALKATDTNAPYSFSWDSTKVANGAITLEVRAYDAAGNTTSASISVSVLNTVKGGGGGGGKPRR